MPLGAEVIEDYATLRLSLKAHPMALLRDGFPGAVKAADLGAIAHGTPVTVAGLVLVRQRPGTAKGVIFMTLEDETGAANVIVWPKVYARFRRTVIASRLVEVSGVLQREGLVIHVVASALRDCSQRLAWLLEGGGPAKPAGPRSPLPLAPPFPSRNFH
jgi:error-prone DNA polymerase